MDDPLNRRMIVALLALLPIVLFALACQSLSPPPGQAQAAQAAELAALPGTAVDAPIVGLEPAPGTLSADAMDAARAANARDPFTTGAVPPAPPFRFTGSVADQYNARECLALAAMAEAGPSEVGQRAVIQVILNRVRHPAFAKTVCGVVFEGSQRATGCQFTFTCDGSLQRRYGEEAWAAARARATQALAGAVFAQVGSATHYHTDWVYPDWSPKLEKLTQVETHLFFRWPGRWGTAQSWTAYRGGEPSLAALIAGSMPIADASGVPDYDADASTAIAPLPPDTPKVSSGEVVMRLPSGRGNFIVVASGAGMQAALDNARKLCTGEGTCRVMGWLSRGEIPASFPLPRAARDSLQFSYTRDPAGGEIVLYNCDTFKGLPREQCIPRGR
ncbi:MAG: cell wall hydrolase [Sphingomonadaceae bacterium]